jgi:hypothetical protein
MAFDEQLANRIREKLSSLKAEFTEKKIFSGICFLVDDKMICGTHIEKSTGQSVLMCRISQEEAEKSLELPYVRPMDFTGRPMKGYVFVEEQGIETHHELEKWLKLCLAFNPLAKKSKK